MQQTVQRNSPQGKLILFKHVTQGVPREDFVGVLYFYYSPKTHDLGTTIRDTQ